MQTEIETERAEMETQRKSRVSWEDIQTGEAEAGMHTKTRGEGLVPTGE